MKTSSVIFLVGFMGSGKSTVGRQLATRLSYNFIDADEWIEQQENRTISSIFADDGEITFRKIERDAIDQFMTLEQTVIATGGGMPCFFDNMDRMLAVGRVVFLNPSLEALVKRLKKETEHRPILAGKKEAELRNEIEGKLALRMKDYLKADVVLGGNPSLDEVVDWICGVIE